MKAHWRLTTTLNEGSLTAYAPHLATALRLAVGLVFAAAGLLKLADQGAFIKALESYALFPAASVEWLALLVPTLEVALGLSFAAGYRARLTAWSLVALLAAFTLTGATAMARGHAVDCGCFPGAGAAQPLDATFFVRNALLIISCLCVNAIHGKADNRPPVA